MIFERALRRELVSTAGAVFTTIFTITITVMLIRVLGQAAGGKVGSQDVVELIGFEGLKLLPVILILTGFISVLLVVTRSYQDSEMVVWFSSGLSLSRWIKPVLEFGLPIIILTSVLSFAVTPWAIRQSAEFRERFQKREDISKVSPGKFQESSSRDRVFFVEGISGDATRVRNIFVNTVSDNRTSIVVANEGTIGINDRGDKYLVMEKGRRYDGVPNQSDFEMMEFDRYSVLVARQSETLVGTKSPASLPTPVLLANMNNFNLAELLWRSALPLMALLLMLLAIPLSFVNPRAGRSANLLIALLLFIIYSNMVSVFQAAVVQDRLSFAVAWWPIHVLATLMIVFFFLWRLKVNSRYHPLVILGAIKRAYRSKRSEAQ
ncbi:MAG TPA: LPS export ABC transporter permease LptF [Burkholderiaceae bacterium]|jgi:lipopolysaccharide export system permease protein|nr:LPS export ABC transporter permease LptF [Burkholderiaceae bacterium]